MAKNVKPTERIMLSVPPDMLELVDVIQKEYMYPSRSAVFQEAVRVMAKKLNSPAEEIFSDAGSSQEKKSQMAGEGEKLLVKDDEHADKQTTKEA